MWVQKVPGGGIRHIAYSHDGGLLYTLDGGGWLTAWDARRRTPNRLGRFPHDPKPFYYGVHPLVDGRLILRTHDFALLDADGKVVVRADLTPGRLGYEQIRPDGRIYYQPKENRVVRGWDLSTSSPVPGFMIPAYGLHSAVGTFDISPDGRRVVVGFNWNAPTVLFDLVGGELGNPVPLAESLKVLRPQFTPDGRSLILSWFYPPRVGVWDVATRTAWVEAVACESISTRFAVHPTAPLLAAPNADGHLTLFSLDTGDPLRSLDFALGRSVNCVAFSPDGLTCAVGGSNKQFAVFDVDV